MGWSSMSFKRSGENICWCSMSICVCVFQPLCKSYQFSMYYGVDFFVVVKDWYW